MELASYETVPKLRETFDRVRYDLQSVPASLTDVIIKVKKLSEDRIHGATFLGQQAVELLAEAAQVSDGKDTDTLFFHLLLVALRLRSAQPGMANVWNLTGKLMHSVDHRRVAGASLEDLKDLVKRVSAQFLEEVVEDSEDVARNAVHILPQDGVVLTHSYSSAVLRSLELGFKSGRGFKVYATESYPGMEGKQLAKELIALGVPVTLIADSAVSSILEQASLVLMGADSVLKDGSLVHKVGTRDIGIAAKKQEIPVYSLSPIIKFSIQDFLGERPEFSTLFDLTPSEFVSRYITEEGQFAPASVEPRIRDLEKWVYA
jgi:translation initiation factor 2B subunit (eIF-2B alpha/beta/delta family)